MLRVLDKAGLTKDDVQLVELPSTGDVYPTALGERQVDVAPLGSVNIKRYPAKYGKEGGKTIEHGLRDDPSHLWAPTDTVADPKKAAAVREFVKFWARAQTGRASTRRSGSRVTRSRTRASAVLTAHTSTSTTGSRASPATGTR